MNNTRLRSGKGLKRSTPLSRTSGLERSKPVAKVNRKRRSKQWVRAFGSADRVEWTQAQPCVICGATPCEVAHIKSRGAGGSADDTIPLCTRHHREQHDAGIETFASRYGCNLEAWAARVARQWRALNG